MFPPIPRSAARCGLALAVAGAASLGLASASHAAPRSQAAPPLAQAAKAADPYVIEVKFRDDTDVAATGKAVDLGNATQQRRLDRIIGAAKVDRVDPVFTSQSPAALDAQREKLKQRGKDVPDLTSFVRVTVSKDEDPKQVLADLQADPLVETARVVPAMAPPPVTGDFSPRQGDLFGNFEITAAASVPGALGRNVKVIDLEYGINDTHEDLVRGPGQAGSVGRLTPNADVGPEPFSYWEHGTAVAGVVAAKRDGIGIDGIAPEVDYKFHSEMFPTGGGRGGAILDAANSLGAGDVMTLEMQTGGPLIGGVQNYVPAEWEASVRAAIQTAVAKGIIVVQAAGNGNENLDAPEFNGWFSRANDSGAIIVGASNAGGPTYGSSTYLRTRAGFSTYGSRVDLQALGESVNATGYGGLGGTADGIIDNNDYADWFNGTSSATAVTTGVVAALSSAYEERVGQPLTPALARQTLVSSGLPQNTSYNPGNIGPQIRLKSAIDALPVPPETVWTDGEDTPQYTNDSTPTITFGASPSAGATFECSVGTLTSPFAPCTSPFTLPQQSGSYIIVRVRAKGPTGLVDASPLARLIFFDYVAPAAPTISAGPDSATPSTTGNTSWTFASSGESSSTKYECQLDVATWAACASPYTLSNTSNGSHTFSIRAKDAAGNVSPVTSRTFSVAVPAPTVEFTSGPETGGYVKATPTFTFSSPNAGVSFECVAGDFASTAYAPCTSPWNAGPQPEGAVIYKVRAKTANGTVGSPDLNLQFHDYTAPPTTITSGPATGDVNVPSSTSFAFSSTESGASFECKFDAGTWVACVSPKSISGLTNGSHTFSVRAKDRAGNLDGSPETRTFTVGPQQLLVVGDPAAAPTTASLTSDASLGNALDWVHWKGTAATSIDRKSGTATIPSWTRYAGNSGTLSVLTGSTTFSWTNAAGTTTSGSSTSGVAATGNGRGFTLAIPAGNVTARKLKLWIGVRGTTTTGALRVNFNGQSPVVKQFAGNSNTAVLGRTVTVDYRALAASDTLTVSWFQGGGPTGGSSNVVLYGAALY